MEGQKFKINEARTSATADALTIAAKNINIELDWAERHCHDYADIVMLKQTLRHVTRAQLALEYLRKNASTEAPDSNPTEHIG